MRGPTVLTWPLPARPSGHPTCQSVVSQGAPRPPGLGAQVVGKAGKVSGAGQWGHVASRSPCAVEGPSPDETQDRIYLLEPETAPQTAEGAGLLYGVPSKGPAPAPQLPSLASPRPLNSLATLPFQGPSSSPVEWGNNAYFLNYSEV